MQNKNFLTKTRWLVTIVLAILNIGTMLGTTSSVSISTYASDHSWSNDTRYYSVTIDANVTATASSGGSNNGKYNSANEQWRFYNSDAGTLTISTTSGTLSSITLTYNVKDNGILICGDNTCTSGTAVSVSGTSATFSVACSKGTSGKIFITAISVTYTPAASCSVDPTVGTASLNGSFNGGGVTSLTNISNVFSAASSAAGSATCSITEYGFVWSDGSTNTNPVIDGSGVTKENHSGAPSGDGGSFSSNMVGTWVVDHTYYYKAYVKNGRPATAYSTASPVASFTVRGITFDSNDGSSVSTKYIRSGGVMTEPSAPTKAGNVFAGWYSNEGLTSPVNWSAAVTASATYYAKWYTISVNVKDEAGNSLSGSGKPTASCTGTTLSTSAGSEKYVFKEWQVSNTASLGSDATSASNSLTSITGNVTVTAVYHAPIALTKGTNTGAGTFNFSSNPIGYGETLTITCAADASHKGSPTVTASGTHGTITVVSATSVTIANVQSAMTINISYAAKETATVKLHVAGSTSTISGTRYEGDSYTLPSEVAECPDMGLYGWYTTDYEHATTAPSGANFKLPGASATLAAGDNDFYAVYATITPDAANTYTKITTTGELVTGDYLLVAYFSSSFIEAMKNTVNASNYMDEVNVNGNVNNTTTPTKVTLASDNSAIRWRITKSTSTITIYNAAVSKYFCGSTGTPALNTTSEDFSYSVSSGDWTLVTNSKTVYYSNQWYVGTPSSAKPIYLFKRDPSVAGPYTTTPSCTTHTLTVVADPVAGGTAEAAKTVLGETKTTTATATPNSHYDFAYWTISGTGSTMSNTSDGKSTDNPVTITMGTDDATLTAHFTEKEKCTVVFKNNGTQVSSTTYWRGENPVAPTLTDGTSHDACDETSDTHYGWTQTTMPDVVPSKATIDAYTGAQTVYAKAATLPAISAGDDGTTITYHAVWAEAISVPSNEYQLVTSISQLSAGDKIVIAGAKTTSTYLLGYQRHTDAGYHFRPQSSNAYTITSSKVTLTSSDIAAIASDETHPYVLTLGKNGDYWTFYDAVNGGYLCATTADKNELNVRAEDSDGASRFTISISSDAASITSQVTPESTPHNLLQYLTNTFSCYKSTSGGTNPYIFRNLSTLSYQNFLTTCCDKHITIGTPSITGGGTVTFTLGGNTIAPGDEVETCSGAKDIVATVTPSAGYSCTALSFSGGNVSVDPTPGAGNYPSASSAQNYTLSFEANTTATLATTATFTAKTASAWEWKYNGEEIPDPLVLYVGINKQLDVTYTPDDLLNTQKNYTVTKTDAHVAQGGKAYDHYTMRGAAGVTEVTNTTVTFTLSGLSKEVNVTVKPQPRVHFIDIVHGESFADVGPAVESYVATFIQPTPTHSDVSDPGENYNSCERGHLHLLGWIESTWADAHPGATSAAITGAGSGKYYEAGANINVEDQNGKTFYAVWCVIE